MVRKHCRRENTSLWLHFESIALWKPIDQLKVFFNLMCMGSHDISMFIFSFHSSINSQWNYSHMDGGLSLNMCLELWWQAGRDYNASNIEFRFRSFVAVGVTSVQLKHGGAQQQVCCQNHPMNTGAEGEHGKKKHFKMIHIYWNISLRKLQMSLWGFCSVRGKRWMSLL